MSRPFHQSFPSATRPLLAWHWRGSLENSHIEETLMRFSQLGFGGILVAPRGENALLNFPSKAWLEVLAAVEAEASRLGMELWIEIPLADPFGAGVFKDLPVDLFIERHKNDPFPGTGMNLLATGAASRFIRKFLVPHEPFARNGKGALRGIFLGRPQWPLGCEPWSEEIALALRDQGFARPPAHFSELFDGAAGNSNRSFSFNFRRTVARKIQSEFASPLLEWTEDRDLRLAGPAECAGDTFPAWAFSAAGAIRRIDTLAGQPPDGLQWDLCCRSWSETVVSISLTWDSPDGIGAESVRRALEPILILQGARAILGWAPWNEADLELDDPFAPLPCAAPGLEGLKDLNLRLTSWTSIGRASVSQTKILAIHPRTSQWRLPNAGAGQAAASAQADTGDNEDLRLKNLWRRLGGSLDDAGFSCDSWDERCFGEMPTGHSGKLRFGDSEYEIAILPGLLNLTKETWICLADFAASGGKVLALERYPAFVDGAASDDLSNWARRYVERFKTTGNLVAWLKDRVRLPVTAASGSLNPDAPIPRIALCDAEDGKQWIVVRNPDCGVPSQGIVEIDAGIGDDIEDVCLETGSVACPSSMTRTESTARLKMEFAAGETRLLRRRKSQGRGAGTKNLIYEECLSVDWRVRRIGDNLFPLSEFEYSLHSLPWMGPEPLVELHQALLRQAPQWSGGPQSDIRLRSRFSLGQMPLIGAGELLSLGLLVSPKAPIRSVSINGKKADLDDGVSSKDFGLVRIPLPGCPCEGENNLEIQVEYAEAQELRSILSGPWILTGRFGVGRNCTAPEADRARQLWRLDAMPGDTEWLAHFVNREMSIVGGIRLLERKQRMKPFEPWNPAWADWAEWPLLSGRRTMAEIGFPFYGGAVELQKDFFAPDSKSRRMPWRSASFQLGPSSAAWAEVEINGKVAGGLSMSPFRREIGALLKPGGRNTAVVRAWMPWLNALAPFQRCARGAAGQPAIIPFGFCQAPKILYFR